MNEFKIITNESDWRDELGNYKKDWYHTWDYHFIAKNNHEGTPLLFVLIDGEERIALPLLLRDIPNSGGYFDLHSVYGYPGLLFNHSKAYLKYDLFIEALQGWCAEKSVVSIFSRLNSLVLEDDFSLKGIVAKGETVVVDLTLTEDEQKSLYRKNYRNLIRKLERDGFRADWSNSSESISEFKLIYTETMKSLEASDFYYFNDEYYNSLFSSEDFQTRVYNVWLGDVKVCSGIFIYCDDFVQYHLSGTLPEYKNLAPTRLLIDQARKDAAALNFKFLHLGGGVGGGRDSLFNFKYGFSKRAIDFNVFNMITDVDVYTKLSFLSEQDSISHDDFFPLYRKDK
jgi:lipid II:glycine glycyltransferase (peptidoglycan interpeptide bridge formation enzyme)